MRNVNKKADKIVNGYVVVPLTDIIQVMGIISIHYFEYSKNFVFEGEEHDFWELVYVDRGEVEIIAGANGLRLKQGEMIFHKPNEFHNIWADGRIAPNIIVIAFDCHSNAMEYFNGKILEISQKAKDLLSGIIVERKNAFKGPFDDPYIKQMIKRKDGDDGGEQMIKIYLEQLLIHLIRRGGVVSNVERSSNAIAERTYTNITSKIAEYLKKKLYQNLSLDEISREFRISKSYLVYAFRQGMGDSLIKYFTHLKMEEAKRLIREENYNISEISDMLGYSSIHYFSRIFKQKTNMSPREYARSVKAKAGM